MAKIIKAGIPASINKNKLMKLDYLDLERLDIWARYHFAIKKKQIQDQIKSLNNQFDKVGGTTYQSYINDEF